jgi:tungstate transport system ATP-binding protein
MSDLLPLRVIDLGYAANGAQILQHISAEFAAGPVSVILGANGAGKSVLLRLCHGLLQPTSGSVVWGGRFSGDPRRHQAMVFQRPVMLRRSALARVSLLDLADRPARLLSGGEQQRLALARAWARRPEILFLDEPTASLDPSATRTVEAIVAAIAAEGTKVIMTTHDLGQARRLADEILFLNRGRLIERASRDLFFAEPATAAAAAFIQGDLPWD